MAYAPHRTDYENREQVLLDRKLKALESLPVLEKRENTARFIEVLKTDRELFAERLSWLVNGSYGRGAQTRLLLWLDRAKTSRKRKLDLLPRWLSSSIILLLGSVEWSAPQSYTPRYWKALSQEDWHVLAQIIHAELIEIEEQ